MVARDGRIKREIGCFSKSKGHRSLFIGNSVIRRGCPNFLLMGYLSVIASQSISYELSFYSGQVHLFAALPGSKKGEVKPEERD